MTAQPPAKKGLGQNFLVDQNYVRKIVDALNPKADETIIEIGPGRGALTESLIERAGRVLAIELDEDLIPLLRDKFKTHNNFDLLQADALRIDFTELVQKQTPGEETRVRVVANLPYYISTAILQRLVEHRAAVSEAVLMLQREVVERITALPGSSERGYLTVLLEASATAEKLFDVPPTAFRPVPKVWSSITRIKLNQMSLITQESEKVFLQIVSSGFLQRRKTILNNLKNADQNLRVLIEDKGGASKALELAQIEANRRAETLTLEEWQRLARQIAG